MKDMFANLSPIREEEEEDDPEPLLLGDIREELLSLSESGEIKYPAKYIKKANYNTLKRIKKIYDKKLFDETNEFISSTIISKFSDLLESLNLIKDSPHLKKDLFQNKLIKKDMKDLVGLVTPLIPSVSLLCGAVTVGEHVITHKFSDQPIPRASAMQRDSASVSDPDLRPPSDFGDTGYDTVM